MTARQRLPIFAQWQPVYAEHNIPTFPCRPNKRPAVRNYGRFGLRASAKIVVSFPDADAFGFMCGPRSNITVLDVDSQDECILADAIDRHGKTPIIARSGSGHFQAWYRHNGERRRIRPDRNVPIDVLGTNGHVVGPPSQVTRGDYQFIEGSLDDLHNLPALLNVEAAIEKPPILADEPAPTDWVDMVEGDGRNNELFRDLCRAAHHVASFDELLDYGRIRNGRFGEPMIEAEVLETAKSAWTIHRQGRNRFGQIGSWQPQALVKKLATTNPDALALLDVLKAHHGPEKEFAIANGMAGTAITLGWRRFAEARKLLIEMRLVRQVSPQTRHRPAMYSWPWRRRTLTTKKAAATFRNLGSPKW